MGGALGTGGWEGPYSELRCTHVSPERWPAQQVDSVPGGQREEQDREDAESSVTLVAFLEPLSSM